MKEILERNTRKELGVTGPNLSQAVSYDQCPVKLNILNGRVADRHQFCVA